MQLKKWKDGKQLFYDKLWFLADQSMPCRAHHKLLKGWDKSVHLMVNGWKYILYKKQNMQKKKNPMTSQHEEESEFTLKGC